MVKKKSGSKRQSIRVREDVKKKVRESRRKAKKWARRNPEKAAVLKKMKATQNSDKGIPSSHPLKAKLLELAERSKEKRAAQELQKKEEKKQRRKDVLASRLRAVATEDAESLESLVQENARKTAEFDAAEADASEAADAAQTDESLGQSSRRAYLRELKKVVNAADIVLHVLDARDPLGSFSMAMEDAVRSVADKRLVLVLNKADLVPKDVLLSWLKYLRRRAPTVAFKASTADTLHLKQMSGDAASANSSLLRSNASVGSEQLLNLLKNYCRSGGLKSAVVVGVVGYPNVGKSSIINSLKRTRSVGVSSTAGYTKAMQEVVLDKNIRLLDCPGVVFADGDAATTALRNVVDPDTLEDPLRPAEAILDLVPMPLLQAKYALPSSARGSKSAFFAALGRRLGRIKRGGIPDREAAARALLRDWNSGRIPFYQTPPEESHTEGLEGDDRILDSFSAEVDLEALEEGDTATLNSLAGARGDEEEKMEE